jgi:hypothetical protein
MDGWTDRQTDKDRRTHGRMTDRRTDRQIRPEISYVSFPFQLESELNKRFFPFPRFPVKGRPGANVIKLFAAINYDFL